MKLSVPKRDDQDRAQAPAPVSAPAPDAGPRSRKAPRPAAAPVGGAAEESERARKRLSLACGLLAGVSALSLGLAGWQGSIASNLTQKYEGDLVSVVVAQKDVAAGQTIAAADVAVQQVPKSYAPAQAAADANDVVGHQAIVSLSAGTPVSKSYTQGASADSLAASLADGHVAYMLDASGAQALSPLIKVGDEVNLMVGDGASSTVMLDHVKVIALDGSLKNAADGSTSSYSTVTLDVTAEQAAQLFDTIGQAQASWRLVMPTAASGNSASAAANGGAQ